MAIAIAAVGVIDPPLTLRPRAPVSVEIRAEAAARSEAADVRRELGRRLGTAVTFDTSDEPRAVVLVGSPSALASTAKDDRPTSTILPTSGRPPNLRIVAASDPPIVRVGWAATVQATVEARGLAGKTSTIVLEARGAELTRVVHAWTKDVERFTASLRYTPPDEGASVVTVKAIPVDGESTASDNAADLRLVVTGRRLKVLVHEPRPSWNATFVRRALEQDPTFDVSTFVRASTGLAVRAGSPPAVVTSDALGAFDAVIIGAPEELAASQVDALRLFARRRGGAIVLLPDRRPSGRYLELIPSASFDEVLVDEAVALGSTAAGRLRASEMAVYKSAQDGAEQTLAALGQGTVTRPVALQWLNGEGRVIFSGALDAWRFRGAGDDEFGRFWRQLIAEAAQAAPSRLEVSLAPGVPSVGDDLRIRARVRPTELDISGGDTRVPAIRARLIDRAGRADVVRLWPTAETGVFAGRVKVTAPGAYDLHVTTESGASVDEAISVVATGSHPGGPIESRDNALRLIASATGGVAVSSADLGPLERHLRSLSTTDAQRTVHPWRSPWLLIAWVTLLSTEWTVRRRRGQS